jgi:MFS family permease
LLVLSLSVLMGALDIAIIGPALPAIQRSFEVEERTLAWIFAIYVLFNLVSTPLMSKLSDVYGRRALYTPDVAFFALGSLLVALAPAFGWVLFGRAIQGAGAVVGAIVDSLGGLPGFRTAYLFAAGLGILLFALSFGLKGREEERATLALREGVAAAESSSQPAR